MKTYRIGPNWRRLTGWALALSAIPLLTTWDWLPARAAPASVGDYLPPGGSWERADEIAVDLRDDTRPEQVAALASRLGVSLAPNSAVSGPRRLMRARVAPERQQALLAQLRRDPLVEAAEPLRYVTALWKPNDPRYEEQWNFRLIGMEKAWEKARGKGAIVAIIDTGVALESDRKCKQAKDFKETKFVRGYDFIGRDDHPADDHGHGTHVAGTVAESTNNREGVAGIAFEATLMPLKVLTADGYGTTADIADAIHFAADHGAHVINMSLGGPTPDRLMQNACRYAYKKDVAIVCAAGNSGREGVGYPAAFRECIAVSSVGPSGNLAFYSSWGKEVAIAAPGGDKTNGEQDGVLQNTLAPTDGYYSFQGTSMASPHVAGVAGLLVSQGVKDPAQIRQVLQKSAARKEPKEKYGAGVLDAAKAVKAAEEEQREPSRRWGFAFVLGVLGLAVARFRARTAGLAGIPVAATLLFLAGMALPELLAGRFEHGSPANMLGHSALLPLGLLALSLRRPAALRFLAALAAGFAAHLLWDGLRAAAPFSFEAGWRAFPWLWVNVAVAAGVAITALRRGYSEE